MRKLAVTLALVVTLVAATAALAATKIAGTYKTTIKTGSLAGTWQVVIGKGKYTASDNGTVLVMGKYKIKKNVISLTDTGGAGKCTGTGKFKFKLKHKTLTLTKISDTKACAARDQVLSHKFKKIA